MDEKAGEAMLQNGTLWSPWMEYLGAGAAGPSGRTKVLVSVQLYGLSPSCSLQVFSSGLDVLAGTI